jgi:dsRNA-specific ribonuclease
MDPVTGVTTDDSNQQEGSALALSPATDKFMAGNVSLRRTNLQPPNKFAMNRDALCRQIGHVFAQPQLLQRALTHRSHSAAHNERLEFLGDSVVNCVVAKYLHDTYPDLPEGDLSRLRSNLVNQQTLYTLAQQLHLGELLLLGEGERKSAGSQRPSILADALEALVGALFLDGGFDVAEKAGWLPALSARPIR